MDIQELLQRFNTTRLLQDEYEAASASLYARWWQCLRESDDYAKARQGEHREPWAGVAADFGELGDSFVLWWLRQGRYLFGEQVYTPDVSRIETPDDDDRDHEMAIWLDGARPTLYLRIPLTLEKREIERQVSELVGLEQAKQADRIAQAKTPRRTFYPDQRMRPATIDTLLRVWKARKEKTLEWWQIGEREKLREQFTCLPGDDAETIKHKRRLMTLTVQRYYKMAKTMIDFAAQGDFPRVK